VDILVTDHGQATARRDGNPALNGQSRSDPELAREEIQRALGRNQGPSLDLLAPTSSHYDIYGRDGGDEEEEIMEIPPSSTTPAIHVRAPTADSILSLLPPPSRKLPPPPRSHDGDNEDDFEPIHNDHYAEDSASHYDDEGRETYQTYSSRGSSHHSHSSSASVDHTPLHLDERFDLSQHPTPSADGSRGRNGNGSPVRLVADMRPPLVDLPLPSAPMDSSPSPPLPILEHRQSSSPGRYIHGMPLQNVEEED